MYFDLVYSVIVFLHNSAGKYSKWWKDRIKVEQLVLESGVFFSPSGYHDSKQNVSEERSKKMLKSNKNDFSTLTA